VHGYKNVDFSTFVLMMTEAISRNIGEIFFLILSWYSENSLSIHVLAYPNHYTKLTVMRACVHACVHVCVRACMRVCVCVCVCYNHIIITETVSFEVSILSSIISVMLAQGTLALEQLL